MLPTLALNSQTQVILCLSLLVAGISGRCHTPRLSLRDSRIALDLCAIALLMRSTC
jgi:hypothetical protein